MSRDFEEGMAVRRRVLGDAHVDRAAAQADDFSGEWQEFVVEQAWSAVWTRPGLTLKERSLITLAVLTTLGRSEELPLHVLGALNNGVTTVEIREVIMHSAVYAGVPAGNTAMQVAARTLKDLER